MRDSNSAAADLSAIRNAFPLTGFAIAPAAGTARLPERGRDSELRMGDRGGSAGL
jgi:hypothetical protein